ncbi:hypothetical protein K469DRAFT_521003, partial [Zopfia rhizophila CBS 207.26]
DNTVNLAREIAQMPKIYSQAAVTILASRAKISDEGFLHNRRLTGFPHLICELPYRCRDKPLGFIVLLTQDNKGPMELLDSKEWALQERALSPRVLDFGSHQVRWLC